MGQAGSQPASAPRRAPYHEPLRRAPKVLPSLSASPRLRSTDNGAILHSGGTISGRRPLPAHHPSPASHSDRSEYQHQGVYRSRSAGAGCAGAPSDLRTRERDPLHRSHTNLDLRHNENNSVSKRFGSEPDLRNEEEQTKAKSNNKHFRKKYRAPPPPVHDIRDGSSPDSSDGNARTEPQRKLRLFKTRTESKKNMIGQSMETNGLQHRNTEPTEYKSLDHSVNDSHAFERRYRSPYKDKEQHLKYPDSRDMVQSTSSLKREENLLENSRRQDNNRCRQDKTSGCRAKTSKSNEQPEAWKTPLLSRNFRYSDRFKKDSNVREQPVMRREKSFDATLLANEKENESPKSLHATRMKTIGEQLKSSRLSPLVTNDKPFRKSLPSLLAKTNEEKDEFQTELKKATSRIRNEYCNKNLVKENKPSQNDSKITRTHIKANPTKIVPFNKVKESSPKISKNSMAKQVSNMSKLGINRKPLNRLEEVKSKAKQPIINIKTNAVSNHKILSNSRDSRGLADRGQASGKESTPEHSPTRHKERPIQEKLKAAPSKQFYFGMIESKQANTKDNLKDFPGLGSPIIEEISNFHLIEKKLLSYRDEDAEFDKFNDELNNRNTKVKNLSSESAMSSGASEGEGSGSDSSLGIALRLRPTLPKKQPTVPRFSPAAAWKQLAHLDAHLAAEIQPLAVETKVAGEPAAESSPRSEQSGDKSGDSGISGDHANSDPRLDSPARQHLNFVSRINNEDKVVVNAETWTPQQDLGDSSSDGAGAALGGDTAVQMRPDGLVTYSARGQPFSWSLPREPQDKGKQLQQGFNSLQKLKKSVSGAFGAALGSRRFDLEHEPMLPETEQNWFLTKSAPTSLSNPLLFQQHRTKGPNEDDTIKEEITPTPSEKDEADVWRGTSGGSGGAAASYLSWGGHVMYLPPAPRALAQPLSLLSTFDKPTRSKSSGELEVAARAARAARAGALAGEMRERERSASPVAGGVRRALPARVEPHNTRTSSTAGGKGRVRPKRFTFQSTVRQVERRRLAEKLSREADLKEQQRRTELEAMRRVEEEFQRKRAREKANIRQQLRLVSGAASMPSPHKHRDDPDGSASREGSASGARVRDRPRHSNASSEISARSKSTTPVRCVELSEWRTSEGARQYRDWGAPSPPAHAHPPACARMPMAAPCIAVPAHNGDCEAFTGSPRSDNYRLEFARGVARSPRTPRPPRMLPVPRSPSTSGSELSSRQPIRISEQTSNEEAEVEPVIIPTLRPAGPARPTLLT